ncbi:hypothetical protein [Synechococcus sp. PCC 7335]|nr:hypothetical protein [Synechococcus sp. PCC 7335]
MPDPFHGRGDTHQRQLSKGGERHFEDVVSNSLRISPIVTAGYSS